MIRTVILLSLVVALSASCTKAPFEDPIASFPEDQPVRCDLSNISTFEKMQEPRIAFARSTYPQAKAKWEAGLDRGQKFYITTIFIHPNLDEEQVFVLVDDIRDGVVYGQIANDPMGSGFKAWDAFFFEEGRLRDWTIQHPNGYEEGNYVGKFIDRLRGECPQ